MELGICKIFLIIFGKFYHCKLWVFLLGPVLLARVGRFPHLIEAPRNIVANVFVLSVRSYQSIVIVEGKYDGMLLRPILNGNPTRKKKEEKRRYGGVSRRRRPFRSMSVDKRVLKSEILSIIIRFYTASKLLKC